MHTNLICKTGLKRLRSKHKSLLWSAYSLFLRLNNWNWEQLNAWTRALKFPDCYLYSFSDTFRFQINSAVIAKYNYSPKQQQTARRGKEMRPNNVWKVAAAFIDHMAVIAGSRSHVQLKSGKQVARCRVKIFSKIPDSFGLMAKQQFGSFGNLALFR